ncbi:MAG: MATE family efflux transporter [Clostridia bacterium]|nr:MATE family efflux transporter [Clostridia bacterium]
MLKKYFGTWDFYKKVLVLTLPIMAQNGITNLVNMLDNVMVGAVGTLPMTGVTVSNTLLFVFNLCVFGIVSGAGIFSAQFYGNGDNEGVQRSFRLKIYLALILSTVGIGVLLIFGENLISLYLKGEGTAEDRALALNYAKEYLSIMLIGLVPFALSQCWSGTLRECDRPVLPMCSGFVAMGVNIALNYILIFGKLGFAPMGVRGAAIATVISRFAELLTLVIWTRLAHRKNPFIVGVFKTLSVPLTLTKNILKKGLPLMLNEALWAAGMATVNQNYSLRGLEVVAANNILQTFFNVFSVSFMAVGVAVGIILGQMLGAGENKKARDACRKLITFSVVVSVIVGVVFFFSAYAIPEIYNTTETVKAMATALMQICAFAMPIDAFAHAAYFTMRSGGKTGVTLIFDSGFVWAISVPAAILLVNLTNLNILWIYTVVQALNLIKCIVGYIFIKKGYWINRVVA